MAITLSRRRVMRWMGRPERRRSMVRHPWSADDIMMVIVWVLIMPHAAVRFEHDILVPPVGDLSAGGTFLVASAAALMELLVAALVGRAIGATVRETIRYLVRLRQTQRTGHYEGHLPRHAVRTYIRRTAEVYDRAPAH